jgi:CHAT domain-containing protein/tetratricopeptide (TPR) repeat protein
MNLPQRSQHFLLLIFVMCIFIIWSQTTAAIKAQTPIEEIVLLEVGKMLEREIANGKAHKYKIEAKANEFLQLKVEQKGVDVVIKLFNKDGKQLAEMDSPNGTQGFEVLTFMVADTGIYTIEVSSLEANADKGNYTIVLKTQRTATQKDKQALQAETVFSEAIALFDQGTAQSFRTARKKFMNASELFRFVNDKQKQAESLVWVGRINNNLGNNFTALKYYKAALLHFRAVNDRNSEATTLANIGEVYSDMGEKQKALEYYFLSLAFRRATGDKEGEATTLNDIGLSYSDLGKQQKALEYLNQSLEISRLITDKSNEAISLGNIGAIYYELGEPHKALEYYYLALALSRAIGDQEDEAKKLMNIGIIYSEIGEQQKAFEHYKLALPLSRASSNKDGEADILESIGVFYSDLGEKQRALEYHNEVLRLRRQISDKEGEARILYNIGAVYSNIREQQKAFEHYNLALTLYKVIRGNLGEAITLNGIGVLYAKLREPQRALKFYNQALRIHRTLGYKRGEALVLSNIATSYSQLNQHKNALKNFNLALILSRAIDNKDSEAIILSNIMNLWETLDNPALAIFFGKQSVNKYQELRRNINVLDKEIQKSYLTTIEDTYRNLAEMLIKENRIPEAERVLRMLKEEEYFEFTRQDGETVSSLDERINLTPVEKQASEKFEKLLLEYTQISKELEKLRSQAKNASAKQVKIISGNQTELNKKLETSTSKLRIFLDELNKNFDQKELEAKNVEQSSQAIIKEWNDPQTTVISTIVGEKNLSLIVTTTEFQRGYVIPISEEKLNALVGDFRAKVLDPNSNPKPAAQELYNILVKPIEKDLANAKTLVWSLDKFLRYVPITALYDEKKGYLAQNYSNVILALASRQNLAVRPAGKKDWQVLGVGVSKKMAGFDPLSYAKDELENIVRDTSVTRNKNEKGIIEGRRLLNEQFTMDNFRKNLGNYPFTHASTHFKFIHGTKAEGLKSYLLLGSGEKLTMADIQKSENIFKGIELLVLSACETAYGRGTTDGREIEAFGVMAQKKGARAIMATLWQVDQISTKNLMVNFYDFYQKDGISKAEALRQAQLSLLQATDKAISNSMKPKIEPDEDFSHPFYWSGFVLIGNWW